MAQRQWRGGAVQAHLSGAITGTPATFGIDVATGFPTGTLPFVVTVGRGLASEEKILVTRSGGTTLTVVTRGYDNTSSVDHASGAAVEHTLAAIVLDEADAHKYDTTLDEHTQYMKADGTRHDLTGRHGPAIVPVVFQIPHTWGVGADVRVPSGDTDYIPGFYVNVPATETVKIAGYKARINSGTSATVKIQKNGSDVTGFTGIVVVTATVAADPADVAVAAGDYITLVVTAVSGTPRNMSFTLYLEYARA